MPSPFPPLYFKEYAGKKDALIALTVPHGADEKLFLEAFPEIRDDKNMDAVWPIFESYLTIERDVGSSELAHALAEKLSKDEGIPALVVESTYPRGIIDGGRLLGHCLRPCLPSALSLSLQNRFLALHKGTLDAMPALYERLLKVKAHALIDVHTMASYCPADAHGKRSTLPVSFARLREYVDQFLNAREHLYLRRFDVITGDDQGRRLTPEPLRGSILDALTENGIPWAENEPYSAHPNFLSFQHLSRVSGISLDVPKHLLATWREDLSDYELESVNLQPKKIDELAACLCQALAKAFA